MSGGQFPFQAYNVVTKEFEEPPSSSRSQAKGKVGALTFPVQSVLSKRWTDILTETFI